MKCSSRLFASVFTGLLLTGLCFTLLPSLAQMSLTYAATLPSANAEYANGTLTQPYSLNVWYDWVNVSNTQVIAYAMYTPQDSPYPGPIANIVGQHLRLADGTDIFVASALTKFEVYRDLNGDGIPQASSGADNELLYYMFTNMSDRFSTIPIKTGIVEGLTHYQWGISYQNVYGYLGYANGSNALGWGGMAAKLNFDHITLNYDFSKNGSVSNLKTSFDIGKVESAYSIDPNTVLPTKVPFSSEDLSLALLFTTSTYASQPYQTSIDGQSFNSQAANASTTAVSIASLAVGDYSAYDFIFGGNYTIARGESNETHTAVTETYQAKAEAVALSGLPLNIYQPALAQISWFGNYLNLTDLFGGQWPNVAIDYHASSFIYRICFPAWDGQQIIHDPVFRGYMAASTQIPEFPSPTPSPSVTSIPSSTPTNPMKTPSPSPTQLPPLSPSPNSTQDNSALAVAVAGLSVAVVALGLAIFYAKRKKNSRQAYKRALDFELSWAIPFQRSLLSELRCNDTWFAPL